MRKKIISILTISSYLFFSSLHAEAKPVPKTKKSSSWKKNNWRPWAVGIGTVLLTAGGLMLIGTDKHKPKHPPTVSNKS